MTTKFKVWLLYSEFKVNLSNLDENCSKIKIEKQRWVCVANKLAPNSWRQSKRIEFKIILSQEGLKPASQGYLRPYSKPTTPK